MDTRKYDLEERLLGFSVQVIQTVERLPNTRAGNHVAGQLLRSGTSAYPNHGESQAAESPKDFVHKLSVSLKELRETQRWLRLIQRVPLIESGEWLDRLLQENDELIRIFVASIRTAEKNMKVSQVPGTHGSSLIIPRSMFDVPSPLRRSMFPYPTSPRSSASP
jgi:four helix bundle protein